MSEHAHPHVHEKPHSHTHADEPGHSHDHHHHEGDSYFTDQLCMVGLSGAFGMICLCLWFWQTTMLQNMLNEAFHPYVLLSGIALVILAFARGAILWRQSRDPNFVSGHHHDHGHGHEHPHHEHEHGVHAGAPTQLAVTPAEHVHGVACGHDHKPGEVCDHDHGHAHAHAHPHAPNVGHAHAHHDHDEADHDHGWAPWRYVVILVPVILFLLGLPSEGVKISALGAAQTGIDYKAFILDFTSIIYEALPFIVLGVVIAGLLEEFVPQAAIAKVVPRNHVLAIAIGGLLGLIFPMCECGIIVVMKRLLRKGLPLSVCVAYMLAGPIINVVVMTSTYVAFSGYNEPGKTDVMGGTWAMLGWRVGMAYVVACVTALVVDWQWRKHGTRLLHPSVARGLREGAIENNDGPRPWSDRINNVTQTALHDFVDILAFLTLGAILAAGGKFAIKAAGLEAFLEQTPAIAILTMMGIAVLFCLCSEADAFVAANFPLVWPDGSKLAFLVLGPMLDLKLLLMYTRVFRGRLIATIVICLVVQVFAYSMAANYFFAKEHPRERPPFLMSPSMEQHLLSVGLGDDPFMQLTHWGVAFNPPPSGKGKPVDYKVLESASSREDLRKRWKDEVIEVRGQFMPSSASNQLFTLARIKYNCCASDARILEVQMVSREPIKGIEAEQWVKVTGRVDFRDNGRGGKMTVVIISKRTDIENCPPDANPYIQ